MNSSRLPFWYAFALLLVPSLALAAEPSLAQWALARVENGLVKPLAETQPRRFSRVRPPPTERRVRILQTSASLDKSGRAFLPFAVDVRFGSESEWRVDIRGCVYQGSGDIYVKKSGSYFPAALLLGKKVEPVAAVCEGDPPRA